MLTMKRCVVFMRRGGLLQDKPRRIFCQCRKKSVELHFNLPTCFLFRLVFNQHLGIFDSLLAKNISQSDAWRFVPRFLKERTNDAGQSGEGMGVAAKRNKWEKHPP